MRIKAVALGSAFSSASSYFVLVVSARVLSPEEYGKFSIFWGLIFSVGAVAVSIELEASRVASQAVQKDSRAIEKNLLIVGFLVALFGTLVFLLLATDVLGLSTHEKWAGLLAIVLVVPMGIIRGTLIGQDRYKDYSLLIAGEGALRLICFAAFLLMGEVNLEQLEIAVVIGFACWIPWSKSLRAYVTNESFKKTLSNSILVMFLTLGSAFFLVGVPWVAARNSDVTLTQIAIFSAASMLARVPMLIFSAIQALLIPHFLRQADDKEIGRQAVALRILLVAALSIVVAYLLGPTVLTLIFGTFYTIGHLTFALLVLSTWFLILQLINVAKLISLNRHFFAGLSWVPGVITSSTMLIIWATDVDKITYAVVVGSALCLLSSNQFVRKLKHSQISG